MIVTSLKSRGELYAFPPTFYPQEATLYSYKGLLTSPNVLASFRNSGIICAATVLLVITLSLMVNYPLTRMKIQSRFKNAYLNWILSLRFLPPVVAVIPIFAIVRTLGLYDRIEALVVVYTVFNLPFAVWMIHGFFQDIPKEIEEAAYVDGCGRFSAFVRVLLPMLSPGLLATSIVTFAFSWSEFAFALVLTATPRSQPLTIGVWSLVSQFEVKWDEMAAMGILVALVPIAALIGVRKYLMSVLTFGIVREKS
jgi:multiple sugar transport system permease protein